MRVVGGMDPRTAYLALSIRDGRRHGTVRPDGHLVFVDVQEGALRDPTLWLDHEAALALGAFLAERGYTPKAPDEVTPTKAHLADAVAVRDRLLAIVEKRK